MKEVKVWNATKGNLLVGADRKLLRPGKSMWVGQDENVLWHLGQGTLIKLDEIKEEAPQEPAPKKKKSEPAPVVEETPAVETPDEPIATEDSILTEDSE